MSPTFKDKAVIKLSNKASLHAYNHIFNCEDADFPLWEDIKNHRERRPRTPLNLPPDFPNPPPIYISLLSLEEFNLCIVTAIQPLETWGGLYPPE
jgi:hypothetical protein